MREMFTRIVQAEEPADAMDAVLDGHVELEGNLFDVAVPAVSVILAALAGELAPFARHLLMINLWRLVCGEAHHTEMAFGRTHLGDECRHKAREGVWVILNEGLRHNGEEAIDILEQIDLDDERRDYYIDVVRARMARRGAAGA
ncbi:hypothetical protein [Catellatospora sp. NPDC049609]|uniref:hypothetical protein n=1 Tax=Catellatospora sp. NPDC049609 TaxID=3155505 RepID=UPI00343ECFCA